MKTQLSAFWISILLLACSPRKEAGQEMIEVEEVHAEATSLFGQELYPNISPSLQTKRERELEEALEHFAENPADVDNIIWLGRRTAYLMRYREALDIYMNGLKKYPDEYRLMRHAGHRFVSIRQFDEAINSLKKAGILAEGKPVKIEPDGLPNQKNIPLSNTHFNIWYHLGLAHYLNGEYEDARDAYVKCMEYSINNDLLVATTDWLFMTYMRLGDRAAANQLLDGITPEMTVIENESYLKRIRLYQGQLQPEDLLDFDQVDNQNDLDLLLATQGYGVGNWHLIQGDTARARMIFEEVLDGHSWSAFGYIAAEADLLRMEEDQ